MYRPRFVRIEDTSEVLQETMTLKDLASITPDLGEKILIETGHMQFLPVKGLRKVMLENGQECWVILTREARNTCERCGQMVFPPTYRKNGGFCAVCIADPLLSVVLKELHSEEGVPVGVWCKGHHTDEVFTQLCEREGIERPGKVYTSRWRIIPPGDGKDRWAKMLFIPDTSGGGRGSFAVTYSFREIDGK